MRRLVRHWIEAVDDVTVVFHLKSANDQVFPQILSSPAGPRSGPESHPEE